MLPLTVDAVISELPFQCTPRNSYSPEENAPVSPSDYIPASSGVVVHARIPAQIEIKSTKEMWR